MEDAIDLLTYLKEGILGTRWPDGSCLDGVTSRTATMIAHHLAAGAGAVGLALVERDPEEAADDSDEEVEA